MMLSVFDMTKRDVQPHPFDGGYMTNSQAIGFLVGR